MSMKELWVKEEQYEKEYKEKYPNYLIKINGHIVIYEFKGEIYYSIEEVEKIKKEKEE